MSAEELEEYREQLRGVEEAIRSSADDTERVTLIHLRTDITELIALTEQALLEQARQRLLTSVEESIEEARGPEVPLTSWGEAVELNMAAQAPFHQPWGGFSFHNCIVSEVTPPTCRVLFVMPLSRAMQPCARYLEGTCPNTEATCEFSHGHVVRVEELRPFEEVDFAAARIGGRCLVRKDREALWSEGVLRDVLPESQEVIVWSQGRNITVPLSNIHPLESSEDSEEEEEEEDEEGLEDDLLDFELEEKEAEEERNRSLFVPRRLDSHYEMGGLGAWEQHTRGMASRMLARMGFVPGTGLGKRGQGRLEPVQAEIIPQGASLDYIMQQRELRAQGGMEASTVVKAKRHRGPSRRRDRGRSVFDILNSKIGDEKDAPKQVTTEKGKKPTKEETETQRRLKDNIELLQAHEKEQRLLQEIQACLASRERNLSSGVAVGVYNTRLEALKQELKACQEMQGKAQAAIKKKADRKKLTIF